MEWNESELAKRKLRKCMIFNVLSDDVHKENICYVNLIKLTVWINE